MARGQRDRDPGSERLPEKDDAPGRDAARDRRRIGGFPVELESALAGRTGRTGVAAILDRQEPHARLRQSAKALEAQVDPARVAVKIKDHRQPGRGRNSPREQALPVLGLQTQDLGLEPERRRIDLAGVARKQDLALAGVKPNHDEA